MLDCNHPSFREFEKHELADRVGEVIECDRCEKEYRIKHDVFEDRFLLVKDQDGGEGDGMD